MQAEAASSAVEGFDPASLVLDADFDSDEIMDTAEAVEAAEAAEAVEAAEATEAAGPPPRPKRVKSATTKRASASRGSSGVVVRRAAERSASLEEVPRRRRSASRADCVGKPSSVADEHRVPSPIPNFLEVLKRGLAMANAAHKADRVAKYDKFFRM